MWPSSAITDNSDPFLWPSRTSILQSNGRGAEGNRQSWESSLCRQRTEARGVVEIRPFNNVAWVLAYQDISQECQARLWRRYCLLLSFTSAALDCTFAYRIWCVVGIGSSMNCFCLLNYRWITSPCISPRLLHSWLGVILGLLVK